MTTRTRRRVTFLGKSMLWSFLLYTLMMLAFNWDEVRSAGNSRSKITAVSNALPGTQPSIGEQPVEPGAAKMAIAKKVAVLLKTIGGIIAGR